MNKKNLCNGLQGPIGYQGNNNSVHNQNSLLNVNQNASSEQQMIAPYSNKLYSKESTTSLQPALSGYGTQNTQSCPSLAQRTTSGMMLHPYSQSAAVVNDGSGGYNQQNTNLSCNHAMCQQPSYPNDSSNKICKYYSNEINRNNGLNSNLLSQQQQQQLQNLNNKLSWNPNFVENFGEPNYWQKVLNWAPCYQNDMRNMSSYNPQDGMNSGIGGGVGNNMQMIPYSSQIEDPSYSGMNSKMNNNNSMISYYNNNVNPNSLPGNPMMPLQVQNIMPAQNTNNFTKLMPAQTSGRFDNSYNRGNEEIKNNYLQYQRSNMNNGIMMNQMNNNITSGMATPNGMRMPSGMGNGMMLSKMNGYNGATGGMYGAHGMMNEMMGYGNRMNKNFGRGEYGNGVGMGGFSNFNNYNMLNGFQSENAMNCNTMNGSGLGVLYGNELPNVPFVPQDYYPKFLDDLQYYGNIDGCEILPNYNSNLVQSMGYR